MIRAAEIRVIGDGGEQLGVMTPQDAQIQADEKGLDLVEVAPGSRPPVCRIMDYGRYKYEQKKKAGKGKGHAATLKEVKLRPRTDQHDMDFKLKNARRFLMDGDKVKVTVMYRGREMVHRELGRKQLDRVVELLGPIAAVENPPRMEGRLLSMILVPNREAIEAARKIEAEKPVDTEASAETEAVAAEESSETAPVAAEESSEAENSVDAEESAETQKPPEERVDAEKPVETSVAVGDELTGE
jgi:translation initiation factor IF-3